MRFKQTICSIPDGITLIPVISDLCFIPDFASKEHSGGGGGDSLPSPGDDSQPAATNSVAKSIITSTRAMNFWIIRRYKADTQKDEIVCLKEERLPKVDKEECGTIVEVLVPVSSDNMHIFKSSGSWRQH